MNDKAAQRPLEHLSITELKILDRFANRYARSVSEHASLVGVVNLAIRTRNWMLFASAKEQIEQAARRCNESYCALQVVREELRAAGADGIKARREVAADHPSALSFARLEQD